jgi:hypothetical protein
MRKVAILICCFAIFSSAKAADKIMRDHDADKFITSDFTVLCESAFSLTEATKAASKRDSNWLKQLNCVKADAGLEVTLVEPVTWFLSDLTIPWKVRAPTKDGKGVTVYVDHSELRWPDGNYIHPSASEATKPQ